MWVLSVTQNTWHDNILNLRYTVLIGELPAFYQIVLLPKIFPPYLILSKMLLVSKNSLLLIFRDSAHIYRTSGPDMWLDYDI